jgi:hypothetical protein
MRHFSCDLCGKTLAPGDGPRFLVRVEGFPVTEPADAADTDADSIDSMDELLVEMEQSEGEPETVEMVPVSARREYDLCGGCYTKLLRDPLGLESRRTIPLSRN